MSRIDIPMPPRRTSSSTSIFGAAVITAAAVAAGAWIYVDAMKAESYFHRAAVRDEIVRVKQDTLGTRKDVAIIQKGLGEETKRYRVGVLTFTYPSGWAVDRMGGEGDAVFTDLQGDIRARLHCPALETGFEAWEFSRMTKTVEKGDLKIVSTLMLGTSIDPGAPDLDVVMADVSKDGESIGSCLMTSDGAPDEEAFRRIHDSFKLAE